MSFVYSPLRYPGGKGRLYRLLSKLIETKQLGDKTYVEPYAGGAGLALRLLVHEDVWSIWINDLDPEIHNFWHVVLNEPEALCRKITDSTISVRAWRRHKKIYRREQEADSVTRAFATLFLNRTNRSGIIHGASVIGGIEQTGKWKIDARFNRERLVHQVEEIYEHRDRIRLTNLDALELVQSLDSDVFCYLDPPYIEDGHTLYKNWYDESGHREIAEFLTSWEHSDWLLTYDEHPLVRSMYRGYPIRKLTLFHTANNHHEGGEFLVAHPEMAMSQKQIDRWLSAA